MATNVSENGLKKKEDDAPPIYGDVIGNGTVLAQHSTLDKLTLCPPLCARVSHDVSEVPPRCCCWRARPCPRALLSLSPRRARNATRATAHRGSQPALSACSLSSATRARARWPAARRGNNKNHPRRRCVSASQRAAAGGPPRPIRPTARAPWDRTWREGGEERHHSTADHTW